MSSTTHRPIAAALLLLTCVGACGSLAAQEPRYRFTVDFGYRWRFNESGSEDLYRSQVDLGEGPKLFAADFFLALPQGTNRYLDRLEMRMNSWGGEPYNTAQVLMAKTGVYTLRFDYSNVQYFESVPAFANPFFETGNLVSQHRWDISRRNWGAEARFFEGHRFSPYFAYRRFTRQGPVATTISADGDEFRVRSDLETSADDIRGGINVRLNHFSFLFEQGVRLHRDRTATSASGPQDGNSTRPLLGQDIVLDGYNSRNHYDTSIPFTTVVVGWEAHPTLFVRAKASYSLADMDAFFSEQYSGRFFASSPLFIFYDSVSQDSAAKAKHPQWRGEITAEWSPLERLRFQERFATRRLHISGSSVASLLFAGVDSALGRPTADPLSDTRLFEDFISVDADTQEIVGIVEAAPHLSLRLGHRFERKRIEIEDRFSQDRNVLLAGASLDFSERCEIGIDYEFGRSDQPILRTDAVDFERLRLHGKATLFSTLHFAGSVLVYDHDDDLAEIDFTSENRDVAVNVDYTPASFWSVSADYERNDYDSNLIFLIPQILQPDRSIYSERADYGGASVNLDLPRKVQLSLGYSFWDVVGTFPLSSHRPTARLEVPIGPKLTAYTEWNSYDYKERTSLLPQQYQTQLLVVGLRVTFGQEP